VTRELLGVAAALALSVGLPLVQLSRRRLT
jgi:hypothetical protein